MKTFSNAFILSAVLALSLAACASGGARQPAATAAQRPTGSATPMIGILPCDDYLAIYRACHQEARTYAADQLQAHYQSMRDILWSESNDPQTRPLLANRCRFLKQQIVQAAHDPACGKR